MITTKKKKKKKKKEFHLYFEDIVRNLFILNVNYKWINELTMFYVVMNI